MDEDEDDAEERSLPEVWNSAIWERCETIWERCETIWERCETIWNSVAFTFRAEQY